MIVRVAEVQRKPPTVTTSTGPMLSVVCTVSEVRTPRAERGAVNSTDVVE